MSNYPAMCQRPDLSIRRRFHAVTLTFDHFILNVCGKSGVTWSNCTNFESAADFLMIYHIFTFQF